MITSRQVWDAIPARGFIARYIRWASRWIGAAEPFHLGSALTLLAQAFPEDFGLPTGSYPLRGNVYVLLVGPSRSAGKSEAVNAAVSVLEQAIPGSVVEDKPASSAAVIKLLSSRNQMIPYSEFGDFLCESMAGQLRSMRTTYTDLYDCRPTSRVRREEAEGKAKKAAVRDPRWSMLCACADGFLELYTIPTDYDSGFMARYFMIYADRPEVSIPPISPEKDRERESVIKSLRHLVRPAPTGRDPFLDGESTLPPFKNCVGFDPPAKKCLENHLKKARERSKAAPHCAKAAIAGSQGHILKTSLLLAWDTGTGRSGDPWTISLDDMEHAIAIDELRVQSVVEIVENIPTDADARNERKFLRALDGEKSLSFGETIRKAQLGKKRGAEARDSLEAKGMIERDPDISAEEYKGAFYRIPKGNVIPLKKEDPFEESSDVISIDFGRVDTE